MRNIFWSVILVGAGVIGLALPAAANSTTVNLSELHSLLTVDKHSKTLNGGDLRRYPKLAMIAGVSKSEKTVSRDELTDSFQKYVDSCAVLFRSIDRNGDGALSVMEIAAVAPKLLVYLPYIDLDHDGRVTMNELLSSPIFFSFAAGARSKSASADSVHESRGGPQPAAVAPNSRYELVEPAVLSDVLVDTSFDDFFTTETARLHAFFTKSQQKTDPEQLDLVVITGSNYQSTSGFYTVYGTWVSNQDVVQVDDPCIDAQCVDKSVCDANYDGDIAICNMMYLPLSPSRAICYGVAMNTYADCLRGR